MDDGAGPGVLQLRVVLETPDLDDAVRFLRDGLGLTAVLAYDNPGDDRVVILEAGRATIELGTPAHSRAVDEVERSAEPGPPVRFAFEVTDTAGVTAQLEAAGAELLGGPVTTPWRSLNARLRGPAGVQLTLFEQLDGGPETGPG